MTMSGSSAIRCGCGCQSNLSSFRRRRASFLRRSLLVFISTVASVILLVWEGGHTEKREAFLGHFPPANERHIPLLSLAGIRRDHHKGQSSHFYGSSSTVVFANAAQSIEGDQDDTPLHTSVQKKGEGESQSESESRHANAYDDDGYDDTILDDDEEADNSDEATVKGKASRSSLGDEEKNKKWNGRHIQWFRDWAKAKEAARRERKPIFLQFWKEKDCPACTILERSVSKSMDVEVLSEYFTMLILPDTEAPDEEQFNVLPAYSPRTYFLNYKGRILDVINEFGGSPDHLHFYQNAEQLLSSMKEVLRDQSGFETFRAI